MWLENFIKKCNNAVVVFVLALLLLAGLIIPVYNIYRSLPTDAEWRQQQSHGKR